MNHFTSRLCSISLSDYLRQLPSERLLDRFGDELGLTRRVVSMQVVDSIANLLRNREQIVKRVEMLSEPALRLATMVYLSVPRAVVVSHNLDEPFELADSFLCAPGKDADGHIWVGGFSDCAEDVQNAIFSRVATLSIDADVPTIAGVSIGADLVTVLALAQQGLVELTRTDKLSKGSKNLLKRVLTAAQISAAVDCSDVVALLLGYAVDRGFLKCSHGVYRLTPAFTNAPRSFDAVALAHDFEQWCSCRDDWWDWNALSGHCPDGWFSAQQFPFYCREQIERIVTAGVACNRVQALMHEGTLVFRSCRATPLDTDIKESTTVLPDFSAVISVGAHLDNVYLFSLMGTLDFFDRVFRGTLCHTVVNDSLSRGTLGDKILSTLTLWNAPHNVIETVREWIREFNRVSLVAGPLVVVGDSAVAQQLATYEPLRDSLIAVDSVAVFRIVPHLRKEVTAQLAAMGFDVRFPDALPEELGALAADIPRRSPTIELLCDPLELKPPEVRELKGGKYGAEMQERTTAELDNVIDYAILMTLGLRFEYGGSPGIKRGVYSVQPLSRTRGGDAAVEAKDLRTGTYKRFLLERILRIGVISL